MFNSDLLNDFQREILTSNLSSKNCLNIFAKGIGDQAIVSSLIKVYSTPKDLVLLVDCDAERDLLILENFGAIGVIQITSEITLLERQKLYSTGGVLCVTTRILVVDLLCDRLPAHLITGLLVVNAEK